jgi:CRISPR/Cas system-associated exonuclease Cas4 (RecB family)
MNSRDPRKVKIDDFVKHSIAVSVLAEHLYCEAKILARKQVGEVQTPYELEGTKIHEEEATKAMEGKEVTEAKDIETVYDLMTLSAANIRKALKVRTVLANPKGHTLFAAILPCGVYGKPDSVDCTSGEQPILVELKTKKELPRRDSPWPNDELQLGAYMMGLEQLGFNPPYGILAYRLRADPEQTLEFRVTLTPELRSEVEFTAGRVRRILEGAEEPTPPDYVNKCASCPAEYREVCRYKLC